ncbi:DUF2971 domain-containing protein [Chromohalobacter israelensis]|uniref:DUF2971 family protein n=1 Tax=Chromohalobacter israelensis (strain ATCC BAA-138 / DSM 3043 / CIP 106854 / NCIMB 13768 / 1H11) TaxID=290398 RepID=Q1QTF6_CHRI1|nr:DUF2971 domain-containing protein [Chromohalobacter salexigens]ABE60252.1 hypothetical protein Csal_2906 [Chromohalobacter salexigens DSM 3043]
MGKSFYRFRSTNNLLDGYSELEKQTIYFARPEQLNDPMEGYRDIYWRGDLIAWKNLFAHYVFCLERISSLLLISGEDNKIDADHIPVFGSTDDLPTDSYKNLFRKIKARFLENKYVSALILAISKRSTPIRREELAFYYDCMHIPALKLIFDVYIEENLSQEGNRIDDKAFAGISGVVSNDFVGLLEKSITDGEADQVIVNELFKAKSHIKQQSNLIHKHNGTISSSKPNKNLLMIDFPSLYLNRLEEITFPKWYTSCFMSECKNSSVWGHYGNNHTGMCLIFDSENINDRSYIKLNGITGWGSSGPIYGDKAMEFHPIDYKKGFGEIDFFTSIGSLPIPVLNTMWYMDEAGNTSVCANKMNVDEDAWRSNYWSNFIRGLTVKSKDWEYENEYRLILHSSITDLSEKDRRTLTYDFSSLKGIIFGINTKEEDKLKTIKIIEDKCNKHSRSDFKFYQAYYCADENCIKSVEMSLVKFSGNV